MTWPAGLLTLLVLSNPAGLGRGRGEEGGLRGAVQLGYLLRIILMGYVNVLTFLEANLV